MLLYVTVCHIQQKYTIQIIIWHTVTYNNLICFLQFHGIGTEIGIGMFYEEIELEKKEFNKKNKKGIGSKGIKMNWN